MRAWVLVVAAVLAGCAQQAPAAVDDVPQPLIGLEAFRACPVKDGREVPCAPVDDSPYLLEVRSQVPPAWQCLTFADDRFSTDVFGNAPYPYPDWYTYYGPVVGDGGVSGSMGLGLLYDSRGDAQDVAGALVIDTEDDDRVFVWQGAGAGFVQLPTPIQASEMRVYGVLYPTGPTQGWLVEPNVPPPGISWSSQPAVEHSEFWSFGPLAPQDSFAGHAGFKWSLVNNVDLGGTLHVPTQRNITVGLGPSDGSGSAHWGWGRMHPFNTTLQAQGLAVNATLQPYIEFYAEFHDLQDPTALAMSDFYCGCPDPVITDWLADPEMAVLCIAGFPLPAASRDGMTHVMLG